MTCLCILLKSFGLFASIYAAFKLYMKLTTGWCRSPTCLVGKTVIVTGANTGIGYETALDFAKRGARVILACRNKEKAEEARRKIIEETDNSDVIVKTIDMTSFKSVRAFAKDINETEKRLDILVNNAGAYGLPATQTEDGNLLMMQVNHLSNFLLTNLLGNLLKKAESSRIVNVSSLATIFAKLDINNINAEGTDSLIYANTKLCNILFTRELAKRLNGTSVTTYSLHPGVINTEITRNLVALRQIIYYFMKPLYKNALEGAQTTIHTSVAKGIEKYSGENFVDCKKVNCYKTAKDAGLAKKLWEKSEELVKLSSEEQQL